MESSLRAAFFICALFHVLKESLQESFRYNKAGPSAFWALSVTASPYFDAYLQTAVSQTRT
jgi:hypothetical protein